MLCQRMPRQSMCHVRQQQQQHCRANHDNTSNYYESHYNGNNIHHDLLNHYCNKYRHLNGNHQCNNFTNNVSHKFCHCIRHYFSRSNHSRNPR